MSNNTNLERWRGLLAFGRDMIDSAASEIEKVHLATAARTFTLLEAIEPLRAPTSLVHGVYDAGVSASYGAVRGVTHVVAGAIDKVLTVAGGQHASTGE